MSQSINSLMDYAEALVRPLKVLVVDTDKGSFDRVTNALAPYDADVFSAKCASSTAECLRNNNPVDLVFVGAQLAPELVVTEIQSICPDASVVIMARNPKDDAVVRLMEMGPFTFLKKNGSFDTEHIQKIASQLNLKLRPSGKAEAENQTPATASVDRI